MQPARLPACQAASPPACLHTPMRACLPAYLPACLHVWLPTLCNLRRQHNYQRHTSAVAAGILAIGATAAAPPAAPAVLAQLQQLSSEAGTSTATTAAAAPLLSLPLFVPIGQLFAAIATAGTVPGRLREAVGEQYLQVLLTRGDYAEAAALCPLILKVTFARSPAVTMLLPPVTMLPMVSAGQQGLPACLPTYLLVCLLARPNHLHAHPPARPPARLPACLPGRLLVSRPVTPHSAACACVPECSPGFALMHPRSRHVAVPDA